MLLQQEFKTLAGAQKRAAFETAHCNGKYKYLVVRCYRGERDADGYDREREYTFRLERLPFNQKGI